MISFNIKTESQKIHNSKVVSYNFKKADFKNINKYLSNIDWTSLFNKSKNLQHFYDQFIDLIQTSIKLFIPPYPKNNKCKKYPSNIKKLLKEKLILYKKSKKNKSFSKDYKIKSKEYELAVKKYNLEYKNYSALTQIKKSFIATLNLKLN